MVTLHTIEAQLAAIGVKIHFWGRAEIKELRTIMMDGEVINACVNGYYEGGFALLVATDQRLLLIDKKPLYLTVEDVRYDMVAELDFHGRLLDSTVNIVTPTKILRFTAFTPKNVRALVTYVQRRVMDFRQQHMMADIRPLVANADFAHAEDVNSLQYRVTNPYTKVPFMTRRRVGRFYTGG